jgi:hypothetical protein
MFYHQIQGFPDFSGKFLFNQIREDKTTSRIGSNISYKTCPQSIPDCAQVEPQRDQRDLGFRWPSLGLKWGLSQAKPRKYLTIYKENPGNTSNIIKPWQLKRPFCFIMCPRFLADTKHERDDSKGCLDPWNCSDLSHPGTHDSPPWQVSSCHLGKLLQFKCYFQNQT